MSRFDTHRTRFVLPMVAGLFLCLLSSCSTVSNRDLAENVVTTFHAQFNSQLFETIELAAGPEFKGAKGLGKSYLEKVHEKLGRVTSSKQVTGSVQNMEGEAQINLMYMTEFANSQAPEQFVFRVKDRKPKLIYYEVHFKDLSND